MSERIDYTGLATRLEGWFEPDYSSCIVDKEELEPVIAALRHAATVEQAARAVVEDGEGLASDDADCECVGGDTMDALRAALAADGKE